MNKNIWIICNRRMVLFEAQQQINSNGGLKAYCFFSLEALERGAARFEQSGGIQDSPSLIIIDYETEEAHDWTIHSFIQNNPALAGVPLFFMADKKYQEQDAKCYTMGATVVLERPFSEDALLRIEKAASQHEMTRSYEQILKRQVSELKAAKEIKILNEKLKIRNEFLHQIFGKYFSEEVVEQILDKPEGAALGGEKKTICVLMADLRGFTSLSDRLTGEEVVDILDYFLGEMTRIITSYKGTVIEFIGDAILAVFGAPLETEDMELNALSAGIIMQNTMTDVNRRNVEKGYPEISMGIGIHKGEVFIGNIGSEYLMRYNVIGQAVNLCSRIENYSLGGQILASLDTLKGIEDQVIVSNPFSITMKGLRTPARICEIKGTKGEHGVILEEKIHNELLPMSTLPKASLNLIVEKCNVEPVADIQILAASTQEIKFRLLTGVKKEIFIHADVEIILKDSNAYGKVLEMSEGEVLVHFTYVTPDFIRSLR